MWKKEKGGDFFLKIKLIILDLSISGLGLAVWDPKTKVSHPESNDQIETVPLKTTPVMSEPTARKRSLKLLTRCR